MSDDDRKSPEVPPALTPEAPGSNWIKMREVAQLLGMSERAARDWVDRYQIPKRGSRPVFVDADVIGKQMRSLGKFPGSPRNSPEDPSEVPGSASEPIEAQYRTDDAPVALDAERQLEVIRDTLLRPLIEQNERLQSRLEERAETIGKMQAAQEQARVKEEIARLERQQIEAERDALRGRLSELQARQAESPATVVTTLETGVQRAWWRFWER
jgi:hypothetical protein